MMYIVNIAIDRSRSEEWEAWMKDDHVPEVMATKCFRHAVMTRNEDEDTDGRVAYRIFYQAHSPESLERYDEEHAEGLQGEHVERFEGAFEASREMLPVLKEFS